ncbi:hypothetical protein NQ318_013133 [Aromia moschata]|uniref:alpha-glucosidase n=1 Tax=Aromia moschata TaxID=1265417 RepID=A0AAV8Y2U3_9CUCU|nr:hypothetical protein NQ318_013133 [Aromia moschata]
MVLPILLTVFATVVTVNCDVISIKENWNDIVISSVASEDQDWWKTATIYQIYPRSFRDSDNDGVGDLKGIIEKLDYIKDLGVSAIWLSPIFKSPQMDQGYDISDFRDIDPDYGTLDDFIELIQAAHNRSIRVIIDFVPNHTSDQHEWFLLSANKTEGYEDYYVWADGREENGTTVPPNNWISAFKYSAWTWNEQRQQFYLHQFLAQQPDLNYRSQEVVKEMKDILTFWLDTHNVDGARIDAVPHLVEAANLTDEPLSNIDGYSDIDYEYLNHIYTKNQPETYDVVYDWRAHIDNITKSKNASTRIFMTESAADIDDVIKYYGNTNGSVLGAYFSFNFFFIGLNENSTAEDLADSINTWHDKLPSIYTYNWLLGNHDNHRIASKVGVEKVDGLNMLVAFLPGVQITYNGEEIGMENGNVTCEDGQDGSATKDNCTHYESSSRDYERTPFQWDDTVNAGFNAGNKTWLPVSDKYKEYNVAAQLAQDNSHLNIYMRLQELRSSLKAQDAILVDHPP